MNRKQQDELREKLYTYFSNLYGATREEVDHAIRRFGLVKTKINTFFLVQAHEKKKKSGGPL